MYLYGILHCDIHKGGMTDCFIALFLFKEAFEMCLKFQYTQELQNTIAETKRIAGYICLCKWKK